MKKIPFLILFAFCLTTVLSGIFLCSPVTFAVDNQQAEIISIGDENTFADYINGVKTFQDGVTVQLTKDLDMKNVKLTSTLGTADKPFVGTFDGNGYKISNLVIDLIESRDTTLFAGLFGFVSGSLSDSGKFVNSQIKNVKIENVTLRLASNVNVYAGALVGRAEHTSIANVEISNSDVLLQQKQSDESFTSYDFGSDIDFGGVAGVLKDSTMNFVISRPNFSQWKLEKNNGRVSNFGGLVGRILSSQISFCVVETDFYAAFEQSYDGTTSVGGIVGQAEQSDSCIVDIALKSNFTLSGTNTNGIVKSGLVAGSVSSSAPARGNISFVTYQSNINRIFGDNNYKYSDEMDFDFIRVSTHSLSPLDRENGQYPYFTEQAWHPLYGVWDFDTVWYVDESTGEINLQYFNNSLNLSAVTSTDSSTESLIFKGITIKNNGVEVSRNNFKYGDEVRLSFDFNTFSENDETVSMKDFTEFSNLSLTKQGTTTDVARIINTEKGFVITGSDQYDVESSADGNGFVVVIKSLNLSTSGRYTATAQRKAFLGKITSRLYDTDGNQVENETPAYVYHASYGSSQPPTTESLSLPEMYYNSEYRIRSTVKSGRPYSFSGWYIVNENEVTKIPEQYVDNNNNLIFTFGHGIFKSNFNVFARYEDDACNITFISDTGVARIRLSGNELYQTNITSPVSKNENALRLEIFIHKGFGFDTDKFIDELFYKSADPTTPFCRLVANDTSQDEYDFYQFEINMTILNWGDFENAFTVKIQTEENKQVDNSWIWWVVGSVIGAVVLVAIIVLIVWLVKRNGFGGGYGGKTKVSKKSYKNMYY